MAASCGYPLPDSGGHTMEDVTYTRRLDRPVYGHPLAIDVGVLPIVSITSAHIDENWSFGADTEVDSGDLEVDAARGWVWLKPNAAFGSWATAPRSNKVVVVAGWATTPPGLIALGAAAVRHILDGNRTGAVVSMTQGGQSITRQDADAILPRAVVDGLGAYRNWGAFAG